jgi:hypothetical protein
MSDYVMIGAWKPYRTNFLLDDAQFRELVALCAQAGLSPAHVKARAKMRETFERIAVDWPRTPGRRTKNATKKVFAATKLDLKRLISTR